MLNNFSIRLHSGVLNILVRRAVLSRFFFVPQRGESDGLHCDTFFTIRY